jgi:hypothetical protein
MFQRKLFVLSVLMLSGSVAHAQPELDAAAPPPEELPESPQADADIAPPGTPEAPPDVEGGEPAAQEPVPAAEPLPAVLATPEAPVIAAPIAESAAPAAPSETYAGVRGFSFNANDADVKVKPVAEFGALFVLWHRYQGGSDGTDFNLRRDGGQGSAGFTWRVSAEVELFQHHQFILLYQPIDLRTRATLSADLRVNGLTFPSGTPMQFRYGFDYYRFSYLYDFLPEVDQELSLGLSLQLRVADLEFASLDGTLQRTSQNLGPVPLIKLRGRYTFDNDVFIGTEIDGIGIQFPSEQGSVLGLFFDTSLRLGYSPTKFLETFLNLRYIGGGARGPGSKPLSSEFGDGYNNNFIHGLTTSVGFAVK